MKTTIWSLGFCRWEMASACNLSTAEFKNQCSALIIHEEEWCCKCQDLSYILRNRVISQRIWDILKTDDQEMKMFEEWCSILHKKKFQTETSLQHHFIFREASLGFFTRVPRGQEQKLQGTLRWGLRTVPKSLQLYFIRPNMSQGQLRLKGWGSRFLHLCRGWVESSISKAV